MRYRTISVDDHVAEAAGTQVHRVPASMPDRLPQVRAIEGRSCWVVQDNPWDASFRRASSAFQPRPGERDYAEHLCDYDLDGVEAAALFPNFAGFAGDPCPWAKDDCAAAYSDWLIDEFCAPKPELLLPLALVPTWDVELAIDEATRSVKRGHRGVDLRLPARQGRLSGPFLRGVGELERAAVLYQPFAALCRPVRSATPARTCLAMCAVR